MEGPFQLTDSSYSPQDALVDTYKPSPPDSRSEADLLQTLIDTQNDLAAMELDPQSVMEMILERSSALASADGGLIELAAENQNAFRRVGGVLSFRLENPTHAALWLHEAGNGLLICDDAESDTRVDRVTCRRIGVRSLVRVPIPQGGRMLGVLIVVAGRSHAFSNRVVLHLRMMASLLASSMAHAVEFEAKRRLLAERAEALTALQLSTEQLRDSEERFRSAFEHAAIGKALVDLDGRWMKVNRSICRIVGYTAEELLRRDFQSITHPDDLNDDLAFIQRLLAGEISDYQMVKRYIHREGHLVWVLLSVSLVRDVNGKPLHFISQIQDVTARKRAEESLRASEEEYRATFELAGVGKAQADLQTGRFLRVNARLCEITGYSAEQLLAMDGPGIAHPEDAEQSRDALRRLASGELSEYTAEKRYIRRDGRTVWVSVNAAVIPCADGNPCRVVATIVDVTARRLAEVLERDRRRVLERVAKGMPLTDSLGQLAEAIERQMEGALATVMVLQDGMVQIHGPSLPTDVQDAIAAQALPLAVQLSSGRLGEQTGERVAVTCIETDDVWTKFRGVAARHRLQTCWTLGVQSSEGAPLGLLAVYHGENRPPTQIEEQTLEMAGRLASICIEHHNTTRQLSHLVRHDPLTGMPNRLCFEDRLAQALALARRSGRKVALIVLDVDRFKQVNDTLGHDVGDALLQDFSSRLRGQLRESDTLARVGGDEFTIVLPDLTDAAGAVIVAEKLIACLREPFVVGGRELPVTSSMGIAIYPDHGDDSALLQRRADEQMYITKRRGRDGYSM